MDSYARAGRDRWLESGTVARLTSKNQFDEALVYLYRESESHPDDPTLRSAITELRNRMARATLDSLGPGDAIVRRSSRAPTPNLEPDEEYLLRLAERALTLDAMLQESTLGNHRTARVLASLARRHLLAIDAHTRGHDALTQRKISVSEVIVAIADPTQASLTRTMLRVVLGRGVALVPVLAAGELTSTCRQRGCLLIVDYRLPGAPDGLAALQSARAEAASAQAPGLILVQRVEHDFVQSRLPIRTRLLTKPIERAALERALRELVPGMFQI